ncbi:glycerophosphodiester phosphodiesterase [Streptomyces sp. H27-D2]|uniref:glycerophosphodiester phosphodiesterase n=1 Tax=Streptomyces sp. H27-D2 TaxID=3046304 RepID=UPI002DB689BE|nr:glycerophosphodiester phosphodiesterase family protein [Streptomyces sp. H27-D2]MEC4019462.1 glycerophosphodiester phosphodiesterase family protein [Streptomyces sp. H27-D2]
MHIHPAAAVTGALLGLSALVLSATAAQAAPARDQPGNPVTVSHRGASAYAPENTLASIDKAAALRIAWVENDVQRTQDGKLVIMHDTTLNRTTNVETLFPSRAPWKISDFTLAEIQKLDAGSWFNRKFAGERVPTLGRYLNRVEHNHQKLLMEVKAPELYPDIERQTLNELDNAGWLDREHLKSRLILQSFSADSLKNIHRQEADVKTGFLGMPAVADLPAYARFADQINPSHKTVTTAYIAAVHRLKGPHARPLELFTWTVDDGPTAVALARMGADGIITNAPDVVRNALEQKSFGLFIPSFP